MQHIADSLLSFIGLSLDEFELGRIGGRCAKRPTLNGESRKQDLCQIGEMAINSRESPVFRGLWRGWAVRGGGRFSRVRIWRVWILKIANG